VCTGPVSAPYFLWKALARSIAVENLGVGELENEMRLDGSVNAVPLG
jgi:hypothetical protein